MPAKPAYSDNTRKLLENPGALCNIVKRIARDAGEIAMQYHDGFADMQVDIKNDDSPVTLADREAEGFIQMSLEQTLPGIPVVGEEAAALGKAPKVTGSEYFWLVDPIDGTKEFIKGGKDFTVNIGLIKNGVPVLGVVYAPARGELYAGHGPGTAVRWLEETDNEKSIAIRETPHAGLIVVASKMHGDPTKLENFLGQFKIEKLVRSGSSLKICIIAAGKADLYPRFGPTCEWDTAAAEAILRSAGGMLTDDQGKPLQYGGAHPKWLNPHFVASSFAWFDIPED